MSPPPLPPPSQILAKLPVAGPPDRSWFVRIGVTLFILLILLPFLIWLGMLVDMKRLYDKELVAETQTEEYQLISAIDQLYEMGKPRPPSTPQTLPIEESDEDLTTPPVPTAPEDEFDLSWTLKVLQDPKSKAKAKTPPTPTREIYQSPPRPR